MELTDSTLSYFEIHAFGNRSASRSSTDWIDSSITLSKVRHLKSRGQTPLAVSARHLIICCHIPWTEFTNQNDWEASIEKWYVFSNIPRIYPKEFDEIQKKIQKFKKRKFAWYGWWFLITGELHLWLLFLS